MKYGSYGKIKVPVSQASVKRGKKASERKKDLLRLRKMFQDIPASEIERVYNENSENIEDSILNLTCFTTPEQEENKNLDLLHDMFEETDKEYIDQVYGQCEGDVSKATAFIIEAFGEEDEDFNVKFGSAEIGFVNKQALDRRCNQNFEEMAIEMFPHVRREDALRVYRECNKNLLLTVQALAETNERCFDEEIRPGPPVKKYDQEYPDVLKAPKSRCVSEGYWWKDRNNYFLDGNNVDAVKKIKILKNAFPAVDDVTVKEVFFMMGDNLNEALGKLKELFPQNYREIESQRPVFIPHPELSPKSSYIAEIPSLSTQSSISDHDFTDTLRLMQQEKHVHDVLLQAAANSAAAGNFLEAKKMSEEGKKHQKRFEEIYTMLYKEIFRRNNPLIESFEKIDLHGLQVKEAIEVLEWFLGSAKGVSKKVEVVTVRVS